MDGYSILGCIGILFIIVGSITFWGLMYRNFKNTSIVNTHGEQEDSHTKREFLSERLGSTDIIGSL